MAAYGTAIGMAIFLAVVCFALRGKGHPETVEIEQPIPEPVKVKESVPEPPKFVPQEYEHQFEHYCVKCKTRRWIGNPQEEILKNGRDAVRGNCTVCGIKVFRIGKMPEGRKVPKNKNHVERPKGTSKDVLPKEF